MLIEITRLHSEDRPRWADLWRDYLAFYETTRPEEQFQDTWARVLHDTSLHGLAARHEGRVIGITHFLFHASAWTMTPVCYLQDLYVDEAVRGSGAGRALIEAVAERARAQASTRLYWLTQIGNGTARTLYDRLAKEAGFVRYDYKLD